MWIEPAKTFLNLVAWAGGLFAIGVALLVLAALALALIGGAVNRRPE